MEGLLETIARVCGATVLPLALLAAVVTGACRPRTAADNDVRSLDEEEADGGGEGASLSMPEDFEETCRGYGGLSKSDRHLFDSLIRLDRDNPEDTPDRSEGSPCTQIWRWIVAHPDFNLPDEPKDISLLKIVATVPHAALGMIIHKIPEGFLEVVRQPFEQVKFYAPSNVQIGDEMRQAILGALSGNVALKRLELTGMGYHDLAGFPPHPTLVSLHMSMNEVEDLTFLSDWPQLTELNINGNKVKDLTPLKKLLQLETLYAGDNEIARLDPLMMLGNLTHIDLSGTRDLPALEALQYMPNLTALFLSDTPLKNLAPLAALRLKQLDVSYTDVVSLEPLRTQPLDVLWIHETKVKDLGPVTAMTALTRLYAKGIPATTLPTFNVNAPLKTVDLGGSAVADVCPLLKVKGLDYVTLPNKKNLQKGDLKEYRKTRC